MQVPYHVFDESITCPAAHFGSIIFRMLLFFPGQKKTSLSSPTLSFAIIPTYISITKNIFSFKERMHDWEGRGKTLFYRTFLAICCQLDGKHGSQIRLSAIISDFKNEHGAIFKKTLSFASLCRRPQGVIY